MKNILCRLGFHRPDKYNYIKVTRRHSKNGKKYHRSKANIAVATPAQGVYLSVLKMLETLPDADVEEVKHGKWLHDPPYKAPNGQYLKASECSVCHSLFTSSGNEPYTDHPRCCRCGAKMEGSE